MSALKHRLKEIELISNTYTQINKLLFLALYETSPVLASKYLFRKATGKKLNLKNPQDFNEKLQWLKLYWQNPLVVKCADKFELRDYVITCGCEEILNELYGVYENASEINWDSLPQKFALKCTHGCGFNIICDDKEKLDKDQTFIKLSEWMKIKYDRYAAEVHYGRMKPRIICEKYIETEAGLLPNDYKVYCFNGKPQLILVCTERAKGYNRVFLDLKWEKINITKTGIPISEIPDKPVCLDDMIKIAERLSNPFPFVRIDFYDFNGKPVLGEMTFTPVGCMANYYNEFGLKHLGDMIQLPEKYI